jgi:hypothetical protein
MLGMLDHHARIDFARDHAATLREVMRTSRRQPPPVDDADQHKTVPRVVAAQAASRRARCSAVSDGGAQHGAL